VKFAFVNGRAAIVIRYWEERGTLADGGARVEIRRVEQVEGPSHRPGAAGFTVAPVGGGGGIWRADLFLVLSQPGTSCFHYHPQFESDDVGERFFEPDMAADPRKWITAKLTDITGTLVKAGAADVAASINLDEHERALPLMLAAVDACLARLPAALTRQTAVA
jgi:hypothetical protein